MTENQKKKPRSPLSTAIIIARAMNKKNEETAFTRCQLSLKGIGAIANRDVIDPYFMTVLSSSLMARGWNMFQISNTSYGLIMIESASGFRKISSQHILSLGEKETQN